MPDSHPFTISFHTECPDVGDSELHLRAVAGRSALSRPYEHTLFFDTEIDGGLSAELIDDLLRFPCRFVVDTGSDAGAQEIHGVLRSLELLPAAEPSPVRYRAELVPRLWRLSLARGSRVFRDMTWPAIVAAVLDEHGVRYELRLADDYPVREYTVQYRESDLAFVSRLLEYWGIYYYFEQLPDAERMIIGDRTSALTVLDAPSPVPYVTRVGESSDAPASVWMLGRKHEVQPSSVRVEDYNWREPTIAPVGETECDGATGHGTERLYGEHVKTPDEAARVAALRADRRRVEREHYRGHTNLASLAPGHGFELSGHPLADLDQEYVVTELEERLHTDGESVGISFGHERRFRAIPYAVAPRPALSTPRPRIHGFVNAIVDGATAGSAAPIDELGRYKLIFPFDLAPQAGGSASRWVRMAQSSTGDGYGMHLPLHIGSEVAVFHVDGDPDRPVIAGAVPNKDTTSPVTQAVATKSRIQTKAGILVELEDDI